MSLESELVTWLDAGLSGSGIAQWDESTQTGMLFAERLPTDDTPAISIQTTEWAQHRNGVPGMLTAQLAIFSQGNLIIQHNRVAEYFTEKGAGETLFRPIDLTSFRIENLVWAIRYPAKVGTTAGGGFLLKTTSKLIVKEL